MDRTYIQSQHIVERYLSGDLSVREAREFEKFCMDNPDVLNSLPIPVRVKARMARKPGVQEHEENDQAFDPTATDTSIMAAGLDRNDDDDDDDDDAKGSYRGLPTQSNKWAIVFGVALIISLAGAGVLYFQNTQLEKRAAITTRTAKAQALRAPGSMQEYRVVPRRAKPTSPTVRIGSPDPPQLIELHVDLSEGKIQQFLITIDNVDLGRVMQIRRVARDTNGELRIGINSSALIPGDYDIAIEGYNWRGNTTPVGWIRLGLQ